MTRHASPIAAVGLIAVLGLVTACGSTSTPAPTQVTAAGPSAAPSAAPSSPASTSPSSSVASDAPTQTATPTATPLPTPGTGAPWTIFTSKRYRYVMAYPPTWTVTPGTTRTSDRFDPGDYPHIYVDRVTRSASLSVITSAEIATIKSHFKAKLLSSKPIRLAGYPGRLLKFDATESDFAISIQEVVLEKSGIAYYLTMYADRTTIAADTATFHTMYGTWKPR